MRSNLYEDDDRGGNGNGRHGVHHDAERTMVGIGAEGMDVRHLNYGEQGQQDKANHRGHRE